MPGKDLDAQNNRGDGSDAADPAGVALGIIDRDGTLRLANYGWCGDGRDRHAPKALQVKPGASCSLALRVLAQRGDESAKRVLQAFDWILSGVVRSIRCEFFEPLPEIRWFDLTLGTLRDNSGIIVTSMDVTARRRVDVSRLAADVIAQVSRVARKHNVRIDYALDRRRPAIAGNALQLQEMLADLVLNAIDVTAHTNPDNRNIHVTTTHTPTTIEICVKHHCPESFGHRIGLPRIRRILAAHGGSLAAHPLGSHGVSVQVTLPLTGQSLIDPISAAG